MTGIRSGYAGRKRRTSIDSTNFADSNGSVDFSSGIQADTTPVVYHDSAPAGAWLAARPTVFMMVGMTISAAILFLISLLVGVAAAPDMAAAYRSLGIMGIGLAVVASLFCLGKMVRGNQAFIWFLAACSLLAGGLGIYYLAAINQNSLNELPALLGADTGFMLAVTADRPLESIHDNVMASGLVVLLCLGMGAILIGHGRAGSMPYAPVAISVPALLLASVALLATHSYGGFVALAAGAIAAAFAWQRRVGNRWSFLGAGSLAVLTLLFLGVSISTVLQLADRSILLLLVPEMADWLAGRIAVWHEVMATVRDYRFTGSGLGATDAVFSTYLFVLHVPFLTHAHNLFLQIAVAQGLAGLIAFLFLLVGTGWAVVVVLTHGDHDEVVFGVVALAALTALLVHGMVDAGLYVSRMAPVLFLPFALIWSVCSRVLARLRIEWNGDEAPVAAPWELALVGVLTPLAVFSLLLLSPNARSAMHANWGAVLQTKAELSVYSWPEWPMQDVLRRDAADGLSVVDLSDAIRHYAIALQYHEGNVTANRRMAQISLAKGDAAGALQHLRRAHETAPNEQVTLRLLGEALAVTGQTASAADIWTNAQFLTSDQLEVRRRWYQYYGTQRQLEWFNQAASAYSQLTSLPQAATE